MKLWISAEYSGDIDDQIRISSNFVEDEINSQIEQKSYDIELDSWDCIAIVMEDDSDYEEITKYSKKRRDMDFRLRLDFDEFVNSSSLGQQKLIYQMLLRSLDLLLEKGANGAGVHAIKKDVELVARKNGWS